MKIILLQKMAGQTYTCFLLLLALNLPLVFCYDDFLNYHPRSLTPLYKTSEEGVSATEAAVLSTSGGGEGAANSENKKDEQLIGRSVIQSDREEAADNKEDKKDGQVIGHPVIQSSYYSSDPTDSYEDQEFITHVRTVVILASIVYLAITLSIIFCCPCAACRGKRRPGYVLSESTTRLCEM